MFEVHIECSGEDKKKKKQLDTVLRWGLEPGAMC